MDGRNPVPVEAGRFIPSFRMVYTFQLVQHFFHQQFMLHETNDNLKVGESIIC